MKNSQFTIEEMMSVLRRRKRAFLIPPVIILSICVLGAFTLPRQYESSTTILVQPNQVLNRLMSYIFPSTTSSSDPYKSPIGDLNQVVYSQPVIEDLIDSIGIRNASVPGYSDDGLVTQVRKHIKTAILGFNTFSITYSDTNPVRAQKAVSVITNLIIENKVQLENQKNEFAVNFFEKKVNQLHQKFIQSQNALISELRKRADDLPTDDRRLLYGELLDNDTNIDNTQSQLDSYSGSLKIVKAVLDSGVSPSNVQDLYQLQLSDIPFSGEFRTALDSYTQLSQTYTPQYPGVVKAREDVTSKLQKVRDGLISVILQDRSKLLALEKRKMGAVSAIETATVAKTQNEGMQTTYDTYRNLYEDMSLSLERARTMRELDQRASQQFVVINPPIVPTRPSKPNKALIIGGGMGAGLFVGLLAAGFVELFDTRIRTPKDLEMFDRPIVAYLPAPTVKIKK